MYRRAALVLSTAFLAALVALGGCKKKRVERRTAGPAKKVVKLPDGVGVFSSQGSVWKVLKGAQPEQIVSGVCWFPVIDGKSGMVAYWEDHGSRMTLTVIDLVSGDKSRLWEWNGPSALARNLNLRNAPCWHPTEDIVYFADGKQIWQVRADGSDLQTLYEHPGDECYAVTVDPKGMSFAFVSVGDAAQNLWSFSYLSRESVPLTTYTRMQGLVGAPSWSPKGSSIAFVVYKADESNIWVVPAAGGHATALTKDGRTNSPSWDVTGSKLAVSSGVQDTYRWQVNLVNATDGKFIQQLTRADTGAFSPSLSGAW